MCTVVFMTFKLSLQNIHGLTSLLLGKGSFDDLLPNSLDI